MSALELSKQLSQRIFGNLGAVPGKSNVGVLSKQNLLTLTVNWNDGTTSPIWGAECVVGQENHSIKVMITDISTDEHQVDFLLLVSSGESIIAVRFAWGDDPGMYLGPHEDSWSELGLARQLNLAAAIEFLTQDGAFWFPLQDTSMFSHMKTILSLEESR